MATWRDIAQDNFRAAVSLYDGGHYRSATSRFYYAAFSLITGELIQRNARGDFTGGRGTPGHAQLPGLVETHFTHFSQARQLYAVSEKPNMPTGLLRIILCKGLIGSLRETLIQPRPRYSTTWEVDYERDRNA